MAYFGSVHNEFRIPEILSIADILNINITILEEQIKVSPFVVVGLSCDSDAQRIAERSVTLKAFLEVWGEAATYDHLQEEVKSFANANRDLIEIISPKSFKFVVEAYGRKLTKAQQVEKMDRFKFLNFSGQIAMKDPQNTFWILEDIGEHAPPEVLPKKIYFTREVGLGRRDLIDKYTLKRRKYLGTTSMDAELSLISANQARVRAGSLMVDPFVGTGSFLVACAHFGAVTVGGDIDIRVLRGKTEDGETKNINSNFQQYELQPFLLDLIRLDHSTNNLWKNTPLFDAIVTDPPYGVRAGAKKVGLKKQSLKRLENDQLPEGFVPHITQTVAYSVPEVMADLLDFAARNLVVGGYLVYWLPTTNDYKPSDIPTHPCLELIANSEQPMSTKWRRRLITVKKTIPFDHKQHSKELVWPEINVDVAHANYAMKRMNDPNRMDRPLQGSSVTTAATATLPIDTQAANGLEGQEEENVIRKKQKLDQ
uniref:tRNA (guanine(10)-N(2))-methyltransferase n=1 Tax=Arcella intermedia TaxID=1963864 RepID=A0A6B2L2W8_9EUKA